MSVACPLCAAPAMLPLIELPDVPVSGVFCTTEQESVPHRDLDFDYCPQCAFVSQRPVVGSTIDYSQVARPTARQLPAYAAAMTQRLQRAAGTGRLIEVGCNDGTFLNALREAGCRDLLGIEPSLALASQAAAQGHELVQQPLDLALAEQLVNTRGAADVLICRHTLEHVPNPLSFLQALRHLLKEGGLACIEVPSLAPVIESLHIHEIWDEHISYFLPQNLIYALEQVGLMVDEIIVEPYREMQNIVVWVRASKPRAVAVPHLRHELGLCANFDQRWQARREQLEALVSSSPRPRVVMGASHPQTNFLNFSGVSVEVDCAIDDDPHKAGRWLPLKGGSVPILPSSQLCAAVKGGTLLLTGFGYPRWMSEASSMVADCAAMTLDVSSLLFTHE